MKKIALILVMLLAAPVAAFPQTAAPDPAFLQQAINSIQTQRNEAMDRAAISDANNRIALIEMERLRAQISALIKELNDAKAEKP